MNAGMRLQAGLLALLLLGSVVSRARAADGLDRLQLGTRIDRLQASRKPLQIAGGITLGVGLAALIAGSVTFGLSGLCGTEPGSCRHESTITAFNAGYGLAGIGAGSTVAGIVLLAVGAARGAQARRLERQLMLLPTVSLLRDQQRAVDGAAASLTLRF